MDAVAVLIDGDNIGADFAPGILKICSRYGRVDVKRVYADLSNGSGWLKTDGFRLFHAGRGKNAADVLLALDAMELAITGHYGGFVIVSSDSDFIHLSQRLRERGALVIGIGEAKSKKAYRESCNEFHLVARKPKTTTKPAARNGFPTELDHKIRNLIAVHSSGGKGMPLAEMAIRMSREHQVKLESLPEATWRSYLKNRPALYEIDPPGKEALVRFLPEGFRTE